ncbi:hypothetical protein BACCIP111899_04194 [Bacillus rhizoplanae]|uniref:Uncharacterized protein n=1 Tax=Bacillus rhizoplanae TaxID=2880966 RepID=A0ABN8A6V9_9BACI|nr:hypothetical protein BACCIP111899_04194 [Bacillus rhizoplanae]
MYKLLSALIGALIALIIPLNGILSEVIGNYKASVLIHIVGLIAVIIILLVRKLKIKIHKGIPLYLYSVGAKCSFKSESLIKAESGCQQWNYAI